MLEGLADQLAAEPATYLVIAGLVALDAVFPAAPSETLVVAAGVLAAEGGLLAGAVIAAAAGGALAGHSVLYGIGRGFGPALRRRLLAGERTGERVERASLQLRERTWLLVVADFLPGGRTAMMFAAGALDLPAGRFYAFVVPGALIWASFYALLGLAGGSAFEEDWQALAASLGAALAIGILFELVHRRRLRGRPGREGPP